MMAGVKDMSGEIMVTAPSEEEALAEILKRLQVDRDAIEYEVSSESEESLLPGAKPEIEVRAWIKPEYVAEQAQKRVSDMLNIVGIDHQLEVSTKDRIVRIDIDAGEHSSLLIGRDGQNLAALQYLVNRMILRVGREAPMVILDIQGYRTRQYKDLEKLVERAVKRARETGNEIELDPMPASERKYLHHYLTKFDGIKTFSRGDEPERYLVIVAD